MSKRKRFGTQYNKEGSLKKPSLRAPCMVADRMRKPSLLERLVAKVKRESMVGMVWRCRKEMRASSGQGTTEYAILVGVLVVIAILAITVFRPKLQELWDAIASGINSL